MIGGWSWNLPVPDHCYFPALLHNARTSKPKYACFTWKLLYQSMSGATTFWFDAYSIVMTRPAATAKTRLPWPWQPAASNANLITNHHGAWQHNPPASAARGSHHVPYEQGHVLYRTGFLCRCLQRPEIMIPELQRTPPDSYLSGAGPTGSDCASSRAIIACVRTDTWMQADPQRPRARR